MEQLDFIFNVKTLQSACLFCFIESKNHTNIDELIEIQNEDSTVLITLRNITKYLFSSYEILLNQACDSCTNIILKMYTLIKRAKSKIERIEKLVNKMNEEIISDNLQSISQIYIDIGQKVDARITRKIDMVCESDANPVKCQSKVFKLHKTAHSTGDRSLVCVICGKTFKKNSSLKSHLNTHKEVECPYCFKILKNNSHYTKHVKNHVKHTKKTTKTRYKCDECGHNAHNKVDLTSHMYKNHLRIKPFVCQICQKQFYSQRNLKEHIITHKCDKTNTCEVCGIHFCGKKTLTNHLKLHSMYRSYKCEVCSHTFVTVSRRNEHVKRKHGEKQFSCMLCEKKFCLNKALNRHVKVCHGPTSADDIPNLVPDRSITPTRIT